MLQNCDDFEMNANGDQVNSNFLIHRLIWDEKTRIIRLCFYSPFIFNMHVICGERFMTKIQEQFWCVALSNRFMMSFQVEPLSLCMWKVLATGEEFAALP